MRRPVEDAPPPWAGPVLTAALLIGLLLMALQLWILTVALDLFLAGRADGVPRLAAASGLVFLGGLLVLRLLGARDRVAARVAPPRGRP